MDNYFGIGDQQKSIQKAKISSCFNKIEKADKGKVLGYTHSSKPVYESEDQSHIKSYGEQDHKDAREIHLKEAIEHRKLAQDYKKLSDKPTKNVEKEVSTYMEKEHKNASQFHRTIAEIHSKAGKEKAKESKDKEKK